MRVNHQGLVAPASTRLDGVRIARISTVPFYVVAQLKAQLTVLGCLGARVLVVASNEPEFSELEGITGVSCHAIDIPRAISPWRDCLALVRLWRFFHKHKIQIAHSTTPKAGLLSAVAAFLARVPIRLHTYTGQPWVTLTGFKRFFARVSDIVIGHLNTKCYTDSHGQRSFLIAQSIIAPEKIDVIGLGSLAGIDTKRFERSRFSAAERATLRESLGIPEDAPVLLFVGRITVDKGIRELLWAFDHLKARGSAAHLVLVGRFDTESGVENTILPTAVVGNPAIHAVEYTHAPEAYMAIADVLCLPSYREGFGTVVIEAAAMGLPTIGSDIYGLSDAVLHDQTGLLVPPRDANALAECIDRLLSDTDLRERLGEAARHRVLEQFDAEAFNQEVAADYVMLLCSAGIFPPSGAPQAII